ncbi:hypothetical protein PO909_001508 [Leuciscus waleckii]
MFPTSLLLLLAAMTRVECNIILTQPNSIVLRPGDSFTLKCEVSGYSVTDNSYATAWIRQPAGKALEWIVHIWGDVSGISLTSSPAQIKAPGQSVRLSCQISGYALKDYGTAWIRQPPGKPWSGLGSYGAVDQ